MGHGKGRGLFSGTFGARKFLRTINDGGAGGVRVGKPLALPSSYDGPIGLAEGLASPPSVAHVLRDPGHIAPADDPTRFYSPEERTASMWLERIGIQTRSVREYKGDKQKTPDSITTDKRRTLEIKSPTTMSPRTIGQRIEEGSRQSRFVVIHHTGALDRETAESALRVAIPRAGKQLDRVIITIGDGNEYVEWRRPR